MTRAWRVRLRGIGQGLPYTNLVCLGHSTAVGLADILAAASPETIPVIGVLSDEAPSMRGHEDIEDLVGLAAELDLRLGTIGGDHRSTWSLLRTVKSALPSRAVQYIHVDAHHDLNGYRSDRHQPPLSCPLSDDGHYPRRPAVGRAVRPDAYAGRSKRCFIRSRS